jgi:dipeptidyl aminopeptidase/acylaminoacyl peptidase
VRPLKGAAVACALGTLTYLGGGLLISWWLNRFPPRMRRAFTFSPWELQLTAETVRFGTADGIELTGWFLPGVDPAAPVILALHGYRRERSEVLGISSYLWRRGYSVLLFDFRGRGGGERARISMGAYEARDLAGALAWVRSRRPEARVGIIGYSMGGAVALMEGGRHEQVKAIVADCAYATQAGVVSYGVQRLIRLRGDFMLPAAALFHRGARRPHFREVTPIAHADEWRGRALFFIGAGRDGMVAPEDARRLFEAAPEPKVLWMVQEAPHCGAYFENRERYCRLVGQFFENYLGRAARAGMTSAYGGV